MPNLFNRSRDRSRVKEELNANYGSLRAPAAAPSEVASMRNFTTRVATIDIESDPLYDEIVMLADPQNVGLSEFDAHVTATQGRFTWDPTNLPPITGDTPTLELRVGELPGFSMSGVRQSGPQFERVRLDASGNRYYPYLYPDVNFPQEYVVTTDDEPVAQPSESSYIRSSVETNRAANMTQKYGVEIECLVPTAQYGALTCKIRGEWSHLWMIKSDGSISAPYGYTGVEIVTTPFPFTAASEGHINEMCAFLDSLGVTVNKSCGLHVHVDASEFSAHEMRSVFERYKKFETEIDKWMPASRRKNENTYCRSLNSYELGSSNEIRNMVQNTAGGNRYVKVNLQSYLIHGTVEFRQHSGTTSALKINNWVKFCVNFMKTSKLVAVEVVPAPTRRATDLNYASLYDSCNALGRLDSSVSDTIKNRILEFLTNLESTYNVRGGYSIKDVVANMASPPSYYTYNKYLKLINDAVSIHNSAFSSIVGSEGYYAAQPMVGMLSGRTIGWDFVAKIARYKLIIRRYMGYFAGSYRTIEHSKAALTEAVSGTVAAPVVTAVQDSLFNGIDMGVIAYLKERAEDFGNTVRC